MENSRDYYINELKNANEKGIYRLYDAADKLELLSLDELEDKYMTMKNFLSDVSRYDY